MNTAHRAGPRLTICVRGLQRELFPLLRNGVEHESHAGSRYARDAQLFRDVRFCDALDARSNPFGTAAALNGSSLAMRCGDETEDAKRDGMS